MKKQPNLNMKQKERTNGKNRYYAASVLSRGICNFKAQIYDRAERIT